MIKLAFSKKRLGGICLMSICSDGEPMLSPDTNALILTLLEEGHYVMIVTNGLITNAIEKCLEMPTELLNRLFFKVSMHFEEMEERGLLERFWNNIDRIKSSPCSFTIEYTTDDSSINSMKRMKNVCLEKLNGVLPHINIPRDERKINLGIYSKLSFDNYCNTWEKGEFSSGLFQYRKQFFGKKYGQFCYSGYRYLWVNLADGSSHQCYGTRTIQNFMDAKKRVKRIAMGDSCPYAHCYVCYTFFTLGTVNKPSYSHYNPTYYDIRNRSGSDGIDWVKQPFRDVFCMGIEQYEFSLIKKWVTNIKNTFAVWKIRDRSYD